MPTVLYSSPIFGPVHSRRLGLSLGINLMPDDGKICTFDCIYCECGFNSQRRPHRPRPTREEVARGLEARLADMAAAGQMPDVLTFAGNGEPTAHPDFAAIIDDTIRLRDRYCPQARVSVLSNSTRAGKPDVHAALMRVDNNILKLDTADPGYIARVDRPAVPYDVEQIIETLCSFGGHVVIQSIFMKGSDCEGRDADNTGEAYVGPWLAALQRIRPRQVMVYTIDRETPDSALRKASREELDRIADRVRAAGIDVEVAY